MERLSRLRFENFKALRDCTLELGRFNLLIGPNGSGKSTVLQALRLVRGLGLGPRPGSPGVPYGEIVSAEAPRGALIALEAEFIDEANPEVASLHVRWGCGPGSGWTARIVGTSPTPASVVQWVQGWQFFSFDSVKIQQANTIAPAPSLDEQGGNLANVLHWLRDEYPDRFATIQEELRRCLPEFAAVLFKTVSNGVISIQLRIADCEKAVPASQLSQGTLITLALLTLGHLPEPPGLVCLEEPDRGLHPRLMRQVRDAIYRLAYPESCGETRPPVQVITTTHSPYFLDQFSEHPEEVILCEKSKTGVEFRCLAERKDILNAISDTALGEIWYSGVLGGVPTDP